MMNQLLILLPLCASNLVSSKQVDLSQFAKPCPRSIDDYAECSRRAFQKSWPRLVVGVPEINLPPLDPLKVDDLSGTTEYGALHGRYHVSDMLIYGLANTKFLFLNPKVEDDYLRVEVEAYQPKFFIEGDYDGQGGYNEFVIGGTGHMNISMTDVTTKVSLSGPVVDDRWIIKTVNANPKIGNLKFWASDLFNGNQAFTEAALEFFNENWRVFYSMGLPIIREKLNAKLKESFSSVFAEVPFSEIFPK